MKVPALFFVFCYKNRSLQCKFSILAWVCLFIVCTNDLSLLGYWMTWVYWAIGLALGNTFEISDDHIKRSLPHRNFEWVMLEILPTLLQTFYNLTWYPRWKIPFQQLKHHINISVFTINTNKILIYKEFVIKLKVSLALLIFNWTNIIFNFLRI